MNDSIFFAEKYPLISHSSAMKSVESLIFHLIGSNVPVLFLGEKGSGRGFLASLLAQNKSFVRLCAQNVSVNDFKSVCAQRANVIFFDEIQNASEELQKHLSLFLEHNKEIRICCSSCVNLEELTSKLLFNKELYYQLSILPVHVPPLRERKADIEELAMIFLKIHGRRYNKYFTSIDFSALENLKNAFWAGNVTELDTCIERACAQAVPPVLKKEYLRLNILPVSDNFNCSDKSLKSAVDRFKKQYIEQILNEVRWNQTEAARVLEIQRTYLSRLIKDLDIK